MTLPVLFVETITALPTAYTAWIDTGPPGIVNVAVWENLLVMLVFEKPLGGFGGVTTFQCERAYPAGRLAVSVTTEPWVTFSDAFAVFVAVTCVRFGALAIAVAPAMLLVDTVKVCPASNTALTVTSVPAVGVVNVVLALVAAANARLFGVTDSHLTNLYPGFGVAVNVTVVPAGAAPECEVALVPGTAVPHAGLLVSTDTALPGA